MATQLKKTVKPTGSDPAGDYTSLEACMNANEQNLVTADKYFDVEIDGSWSSADTSAVTIHNYTTDATRYINIYTTAAARHEGVYSTSYYRISASSTAALLKVYSSFITFTGIQINNTHETDGEGIYVYDDNYSLLFSKCFVISSNVAFYNLSYSGRIHTIINSIFITRGNGNAHAIYRENNGGLYCYNSVGIVRSGTGYAFITSSGSLVAKNCYAHSYTANYGYSGCTMTTCASDGTSGNLDNIPYDTTTFVNVTSDSEDFHLVAGSDLINAGTDLSATFTDDIDGDTRSSWDIGADEYVAATGWVRGGKVKCII